MKIKTESKKMFVILSRLIGMPLLYSVGIALIVLLVTVFVPAIQNALGWLLIFLFPIFYLAYVAIDAKLYAVNTYVELKESSIELHSKNIKTSTHITLPVAQVESISISQNFIRKLFGVCQLNFIQKSGAITRTWGYDYQEASDFVRQFGEKYKIPIKTA